MDKIVVEDLDLFYGNFQALKKLNHYRLKPVGSVGC